MPMESSSLRRRKGGQEHGKEGNEGGVSSNTPLLSAMSSLGNSPMTSPRRESSVSESEQRSQQYIITNKNLITRWAFPLFQDQESFKRYKKAQKKDFQWQVILPPFLILLTISVASRSSLDRLGQTSNPFLTCAHYSLHLDSLLIFTFIGCHLITYYHHVRGYFKMVIQYAEYFLQDSFWCRCEDAIGILATISAMFFLLSRVTEGACPSDVSLWDSQHCNPMANSHSIPQDQVLLMYSMPLTHLIILRGFSIQGVIICYSIAILSIAYSLYLVGGWLDIYTIYQGLVFALVAFEKERWLRIAYVLNEQIVEKTKMEVERIHREELRELSREADHEKKLSEIEQSQLRALMGNVAHDLKTPLHSIVADLGALKSHVIALTTSSSSMITPASQQFINEPNKPTTIATIDKSNGNGSDGWTVGDNGSHLISTVTTTPTDIEQDNPVSLISSIESATQFMQMAINRSQDYMKSSSNMALLPSLSTFEIANAVHIAYTCVNNLHSGRFVNILPIPIDICPYIISDRHWLIENLLCLISNAVKYSDKGTTVTVTVKLILDDALSGSTSLGTTDDKNVRIQLIKKLKSVEQRDDDDDDPIGYRGILKTSEKHQAANIRSIDSSNQRLDLLQGHSIIGQDNNGCNENNNNSKTMLAFFVEDNGIGISEEKQQVLFQPFKQAQRLAGGTGLGLFSLARRLEALGGQYGVSNRNDGKPGSIFWFSFPYRPDASTAAEVLRENGVFSSLKSISTPHTSSLNLQKLLEMNSKDDLSPSLVEEPIPYRPSRVLLTDDTHSVLKITGRALQRLGLDVLTAENGSESLNVLQQHYHNMDKPIDVLLTDLQMPVMDGLESVLRYREFEQEQITLARSQKQDHIKPPLIIIGMSANDDAEIREEAIRAGMNGWLTKPFTGDDFARMLKSIVFKIGTKA